MEYIITRNNEDELYHYGVKGMKWGHRKAQKYVTKARTARESAKEWDEMAKDAQSRGKTKRASKYSAYAKQDRVDAKRYDSQAAAVNKNIAKTKANVRKYEKKYNEAVKVDDAANAQWAKVQEQRKALGKTKLTRTINAARGKSDAAKAYNKGYNAWEKLQNTADKKWSEAKQEYANTGRNRVERILNNARY